MSDALDTSLEAIVERANASYRRRLTQMSLAELTQELEDCERIAANATIISRPDDPEWTPVRAREQAQSFLADAAIVREEIARRRPN